MLKIPQARLQQYMNQELPDVQAGFIKGKGTRDQIANIQWIIEKVREFQKNFCFIDYTKAFDCVDHNKLWKLLKEIGIPDHLTCLLRNLYAGQEATVRTRHQIANICWIIKKAREFQKNIYFCFIDYAKVFACVDHNKLWKSLKEMGIPDHLTCLLRNLYAGQDATVRTGHGTTDWFQIGKGAHQGCILSPCLFNFYAEYIMRNARLEEAQAGIKIGGRNINNLRYADDTTLMAEI